VFETRRHGGRGTVDEVLRVSVTDGRCQRDASPPRVPSICADRRHARVDDPGQVEGNIVFTYRDAFDQDRSGLETLEERYRAGGLGDVGLKIS